LICEESIPLISERNKRFVFTMKTNVSLRAYFAAKVTNLAQ